MSEKNKQLWGSFLILTFGTQVGKYYYCGESDTPVHYFALTKRALQLIETINYTKICISTKFTAKITGKPPPHKKLQGSPPSVFHDPLFQILLNQSKTFS